MSTMKYRKHPRVYEKKQAESKYADENTISLSAMTAVGILALVFVKGLFWGYILKKSMR